MKDIIGDGQRTSPGCGLTNEANRATPAPRRRAESRKREAERERKTMQAGSELSGGLERHEMSMDWWNWPVELDDCKANQNG